MVNRSDCVITLTAVVAGQGELFRFERGSLPVAVCEKEQDAVFFSIWYDFRPEPLCLCGQAAEGAVLCVRIWPQRIEMWLDDLLADEEWPCGAHALNASVCTGPVPCRLSTELPVRKELPAVTDTFTGAEGWQPGAGVFVGDCMPYSLEERYHVLYLKDRHHHRSKWGLGAHQWEHISTSDFRIWQIHPMAVSIEHPDEGSICTGSWMRCGDKQYLYYTIRSCDGSPARITRSLSRDGYHFSRDDGFSLYLSDRYNASSARDPKVIQDESGRYRMFLTTTLREKGKGCLAHLVSTDFQSWQEEEPIYVAPEKYEPECCDYFQWNGWYYLVFSLKSRGNYLFSRSPFSEWRQPDDPVIPCKSVPKAALWKERLIFTGFDGHGQYAGTMTFLEAKQQPDGQLDFLPLQA